MIEKIKNLIEELKSNPRTVVFDEAAVKQFIVLPFLQCLGWNTQDIDEVRPESPIESRKVDFSLHVNGKIFLIEVKRIGENLEKCEKQLLEYTFLLGVEFAILTNGSLWWFYLPMKRGEWQTRKFAMLDLNRQDSLYVAQKFVDLLSKENAENLEFAEAVYRSKIIADIMPIAWNKLITQPDLTLIERFSETVKGMCDYRPATDELKHFFEQHADTLIIHIEKKRIKRLGINQKSPRGTPVIVAYNISKLLDAIAAEYLKQPKQVPPYADNVTVYSHPNYLLQFTVRRSPPSNDDLNQSKFDQLEFIATSGQIVNAFKRYCALHGIQNPYTTGQVFAANLRRERDQLSKAHWTIVSRDNNRPYFKAVNGKRYWKFVKTG